MKEIHTRYGVIKGITSAGFYNDETIKECRLNEHFEIKTTVGTFVPQYEEGEIRRKYIRSLSFYENGNIQSISLQEQTTIKTSIGTVPAEFILFYENGCIKRIFPLNGKITGYWTEEDEYKLAEELEFQFPFGNFKKKVIGIKFYKSEEVKSLTFWTKDIVAIQTPCGIMDIRIGLSIYERGILKSCEPARPVLIKTPIGRIHAYDVSAIGINGDTNSLSFYENGNIKSLLTSTDRIEVTDKNGKLSAAYEPSLKPNLFNNTIMDIVPLYIEFYNDKVRFSNEEKEFIIKDTVFNITKFVRKIKKMPEECIKAP